LQAAQVVVSLVTVAAEARAEFSIHSTLIYQLARILSLLALAEQLLSLGLRHL
jgi:hypothetical protein